MYLIAESFRCFREVKQDCIKTSPPSTISSLRGGTVTPTSTLRFFRNGPFLLSHRWDFLASYPPTIAHSPTSVCCTPMVLPSKRAQSLDPTVWICLSHPLVQEHTTIPFIACLSVPFFPHIKGERAGERVTEKWRGVTKNKKKNPRKQLHAPPLYEPCASGFPAPESVN